MRILRLKAKPVLCNRLYAVTVVVLLRPAGLVLPPVVVLVVKCSVAAANLCVDNSVNSIVNRTFSSSGMPQWRLLRLVLAPNPLERSVTCGKPAVLIPPRIITVRFVVWMEKCSDEVVWRFVQFSAVVC
jgi:hypothetical protein